MKTIDELRIEIDEIDEALVKLFERRMKTVEGIANYKIKNGLALKDTSREQAVIEKNTSRLSDETYELYLKGFLKDLMASSRSYQKTLMSDVPAQEAIDYSKARVAFQGLEGAYSSIALSKYFNEVKDRVSVKNFDDVFDAVDSGNVDYGILPIENSSTGAINHIYDALLRYDVKIVGEVYLPIEHHLIGHKDASIDDIREVYSHEQGFKQSKVFLNEYNWKHYSYRNTAESVAHVKESMNKELAAIGSEDASKLYGLKILASCIQDHESNSTRFIVIAPKAVSVKDGDKISLLLQLHHEPKSLFNALEVFANANVNMLKIESRPIADKPWSYTFYIDIEGSLSTDHINEMLSKLSHTVQDYHILGEYKMRNGA